MYAWAFRKFFTQIGKKIGLKMLGDPNKIMSEAEEKKLLEDAFKDAYAESYKEEYGIEPPELQISPDRIYWIWRFANSCYKDERGFEYHNRFFDDYGNYKEYSGNFTNAKSYTPPPRDPFALDLDGDGIETVNLTSGILFDHNADGVKTGTGWVKGDDALLVRDLNANGAIDTGRELFGDQTVLSNGQLAANGFAALADIDSNSDGIIDSSDAAFNELKIWRDLNQDGISQTEEQQTLEQAGIASINLTSTAKNQWQNGNTIASTGTYTKIDGNTGATSDINLASNIANSEFTDTLEIPEELQNLPDMSGSGKVRDLLQAATLSPELAGLLTQYAAATTREAQMALIDQMKSLGSGLTF